MLINYWQSWALQNKVIIQLCLFHHRILIQLQASLVPKDACVIIIRTNGTLLPLINWKRRLQKDTDEHKVAYSIITVPGAIEIPFAVKNYWEAHKYKDDKPCAFITLGCVLRGDTPHFEYVCQAVTNGCIAIKSGFTRATIFGVLTVDNQQQIDERNGGSPGT